MELSPVTVYPNSWGEECRAQQREVDLVQCYKRLKSLGVYLGRDAVSEEKLSGSCSHFCTFQY